MVVFGHVSIVDDRSRKSWFFDRVLEKYGESPIGASSRATRFDFAFNKNVKTLPGCHP